MVSRAQERLDELLARAGIVGVKATAVKAAVVLAAVGIAAALLRTGRAPAVEFASDPDGDVAAYASAETSESVPDAPVTVVVHVAGAVLQPGVYEFKEGARVDDAVRSAGGMLGSAAQGALNLARILVDGEQVYVATQDEVASGAVTGVGSVPGAAGPAGSATSALVNINTATVADLDALPGIGPATAQNIIDDRTANGPFTSVDDLMRVSGIGAKKVDSLRDLVTAG